MVAGFIHPSARRPCQLSPAAYRIMTWRVESGVSSIMLSAVFLSRLAVAWGRDALRLGPLAAIHVAAFAILLWSEADGDARAAFVFTWGFLNFLWLALLRRPSTSGALSLLLIVVLIMLSQFKHDV